MRERERECYHGVTDRLDVWMDVRHHTCERDTSHIFINTESLRKCEEISTTENMKMNTQDHLP